MTTRDWIEQQLAAGLPAFAGTEIAGTLAIKQELINDLLAQWLAANTTAEGRPRLDLSHVVKCVKSASVRAETGTVLVDFQVVV